MLVIGAEEQKRPPAVFVGALQTREKGHRCFMPICNSKKVQPTSDALSSFNDQVGRIVSVGYTRDTVLRVLGSILGSIRYRHNNKNENKKNSGKSCPTCTDCPTTE